jgi:hypothetical protein
VERPVPAFQTKSRKDIDQAEQLFAVLLRDRPEIFGSRGTQRRHGRG